MSADTGTPDPLADCLGKHQPNAAYPTRCLCGWATAGTAGGTVNDWLVSVKAEWDSHLSDAIRAAVADGTIPLEALSPELAALRDAAVRCRRVEDIDPDDDEREFCLGALHIAVDALPEALRGDA